MQKKGYQGIFEDAGLKYPHCTRHKQLPRGVKWNFFGVEEDGKLKFRNRLFIIFKVGYPGFSGFLLQISS